MAGGASARKPLDAKIRRAYLLAMANPLDREIEAVLRKGRDPQSWRKPGGKREKIIEQQDGTRPGPTSESGKPAAGTGMNRPGHPR